MLYEVPLTSAEEIWPKYSKNLGSMSEVQGAENGSGGEEASF